jgi:tripartite ATP-independent transporter DctP family solute receptor
MNIRVSRRAAIAGGLAATVAAPLRRAGAAQTLRWSTVLPGNHPETAMMEQVAAQVRDETGGAIEIQVFPGGQLGSSRDSIESVSSGATQMVSEGAAQFGQFVAQFSIFEAPYIWRDVAHLRRAVASPIMDEFGGMLAQRRQMRIIGATYYGTRQLTSGSKAIHTVDDMKGFKVRIPEVDTFRAMVEAWGARATPLNIGELYLALSQGAVDGQENPLPTIQATKLNEVQKYLIMTSHVMTPRLVAVNEAVWASLSAPQQATLRAAIARHAADQDAEIVKQENGLRAIFAASGMTVIDPDVESFRKAVLAVLPAKFESKWGKGVWDRVAAL